MGKPGATESDFIRIFEENGATKAAKILGIAIRNVYDRRARIEKKLGRQITGPDNPKNTRTGIQHPGRLTTEITDGNVIICSDAHYWPLGEDEQPSTAHRAVVAFNKKLKPKIFIKNGDALDGASISRFPVGWEHRPTVAEEIDVCRERLEEIYKVNKDAEYFWSLGNHDSRLETRISTTMPELVRLRGTRLKDFFRDEWQPCFSVWINDEVVVKHRFKAGIHAPHNNTMWAGKTIITGHLHSLKVMPLTDFNGTRWGVDCGCIADIYGPQFEYSEGIPRSWRAGFCVLTFIDGRLLWPELVHVVEDGVVEFRGKLIDV